MLRRSLAVYSVQLSRRRFGHSTSTRSLRSSWYLITASASKVFPSPTESAMMHPPNRLILSIAPTTPSRWNL
jgi:hypothetical protein